MKYDIYNLSGTVVSQFSTELNDIKSGNDVKASDYSVNDQEVIISSLLYTLTYSTEDSVIDSCTNWLVSDGINDQIVIDYLGQVKEFDKRNIFNLALKVASKNIALVESLKQAVNSADAKNVKLRKEFKEYQDQVFAEKVKQMTKSSCGGSCSVCDCDKENDGCECEESDLEGIINPLDEVYYSFNSEIDNLISINVVKKDFWENNHILDDCHVDVKIDFGDYIFDQTVESVFTLSDKNGNYLNIEDARVILNNVGWTERHLFPHDIS